MRKKIHRHDAYCTRSAAEYRSDDAGHGAEAAPRANGFAALLFWKSCGDHGEAAGDHEGLADALSCSGGDQHADAACEAAPAGGSGEQNNPGEKDAHAAKAVTKAATNKGECGGHERVRLDDPLHATGVGVQAGLHGGQCDVDDGAVDEGHAGAEDGGDEYPLPGRVVS